MDFTSQVHSDDEAVPVVDVVAGSYNPSSGVAYYFTRHGCQVRQFTACGPDSVQFKFKLVCIVYPGVFCVYSSVESVE